VANQFENFAYVAIERGQGPRAARLLGAATAIREATGQQMAFDEVPELEGFIERLRGSMPAADYEANWAAGRALSQPEAVALAIGG
jgi:hypothetical protein